MPKLMNKGGNRPLIGGIFSNPKNAKKTVKALLDLGVPDQDILAVVMLTDEQAIEAYTDKAFTDVLASRGFAEAQAAFYDKAIQIGRVLVAVQNVRDQMPVIDVFDDNRAEYHGSLASIAGPVESVAGIVGPWLRIASLPVNREDETSFQPPSWR